MSFFGESEKDKKIREKADAAAKRAESLYPGLPQEEAGLRDQSLNPREIATEAATEVLGETGSIVQAGLAAMRPKSALSKIKGKMPTRVAREARQKADTGRLPQNPTRDTNKLRTKQSGGPDLDFKELNKLTPEDPNAPIIDYRNFKNDDELVCYLNKISKSQYQDIVESAFEFNKTFDWGDLKKLSVLFGELK